ncbi:MAG TPA: NfeD family protein [Anaerolineales bacterium]|nr:NfeD family protein [Anaerolineales bacterium]
MSALETPWMANVFYLCLVLGVWTAAMAVATPGTGFLEAFSLVLLAGAAIGMLVWPVNPLAFIPLVLGVAALIYSVVRRRPSAWWVLGSAALLSLGSIFLYENASGGPAVEPVLAILMTTLTVLFFWFGVRRGIEVQLAAPTVDAEIVVGQVGEARSPVHRSGTVYVGGELWSARSESPIQRGQRVRVVGLDGLIVDVEPVES